MARRQGMARAFALGPAGSAPGGPVALLRSRTLPVGFGDQPVPLNICAVLVPEAGSAPAPAVWKTAMHLSTPLGLEIGGPEGSRALLRIPARDSRLYGTCRPIGGDDGTCIRPVALRTQLAPVEHAPPLVIGGDRRAWLGPSPSARWAPPLAARSRCCAPAPATW